MQTYTKKLKNRQAKNIIKERLKKYLKERYRPKTTSEWDKDHYEGYIGLKYALNHRSLAALWHKSSSMIIPAVLGVYNSSQRDIKAPNISHKSLKNKLSLKELSKLIIQYQLNDGLSWGIHSNESKMSKINHAMNKFAYHCKHQYFLDILKDKYISNRRKAISLKSGKKMVADILKSDKKYFTHHVLYEDELIDMDNDSVVPADDIAYIQKVKSKLKEKSQDKIDRVEIPFTWIDVYFPSKHYAKNGVFYNVTLNSVIPIWIDENNHKRKQYYQDSLNKADKEKNSNDNPKRRRRRLNNFDLTDYMSEKMDKIKQQEELIHASDLSSICNPILLTGKNISWDSEETSINPKLMIYHDYSYGVGINAYITKNPNLDLIKESLLDMNSDKVKQYNLSTMLNENNIQQFIEKFWKYEDKLLDSESLIIKQDEMSVDDLKDLLII